MHRTNPDFREALLLTVPRLRAFAISLTGNLDRADDLVQETVLRAIENVHRFEEGTSLQSWAYTILRNLFLSDCRKRWREVADPNSEIAGKVGVMPEQGARLDFEDMLGALRKLSPEQREVVLLIGAEGMSYEDTAEVCGITVGTVKSRINRGRTRLAELLGADRPHYGSVRAA
jgi:RNA polymerase sigma-70 factor (ECF subfamily)